MKQRYYVKDLKPYIGWNKRKIPNQRRYVRYELENDEVHYAAMAMPKQDNFIMHIIDLKTNEFIFSYINDIDRLQELGVV